MSVAFCGETPGPKVPAQQRSRSDSRRPYPSSGAHEPSDAEERRGRPEASEAAASHESRALIRADEGEPTGWPSPTRRGGGAARGVAPSHCAVRSEAQGRLPVLNFGGAWPLTAPRGGRMQKVRRRR